MATQKNLIRFILVLILALLQIGCQSGTPNGFGNSNSTNNSSSSLLTCNRFSGSSLGGRVDLDPSSSNDYSYVTFKTNPSDFVSNNAHIKFLVGTDTSSLNTYAGFVAEQNFVPVSGWNPAGNLVTQSFLNSLNSNIYFALTAVSFHTEVGPLNTVLRMVLESSSNTLIDKVDVLIPPFAANPNTYAQSHSAALANLHPLASYKSSGWSDAQFLQQGQYLCNQ